MKQGTKFGIVTGVIAGMAAASGAWVMWGLWTGLSVVGTIALNKRDMGNPLQGISPRTLEHIQNVIHGKK
jgi:hypothetical protein